MARQKCGLHSVCGEGSPECCQFSGELSEVLFLTAIFWNNSGSWLLLWGLLLCSCVCTCSVVSDSCDSMDYTARKASLSMGFPRQEYWSGLSFFFFGKWPYSQKLAKLEVDIQSLIGTFLSGLLPKAKMKQCIHRERKAF